MEKNQNQEYINLLKNKLIEIKNQYELEYEIPGR
jgi:hypothetical protein